MQGEHATQTDAMEMRAATQRYTGPSAGRIVNLLPHRVTLERGWLRTSTAICHGGDEPDGLAFRQRPDGNGIEVRCHTGGCTRAHVITALEGLIGLPIWTAYEPVEGAPVAPAPARRWTKQRLLFWGGWALMLALPLLLGAGVEAALLNAFGFSVGYALMGHFALEWQRAGRRYG